MPAISTKVAGRRTEHRGSKGGGLASYFFRAGASATGTGHPHHKEKYYCANDFGFHF